MSPSPAGPVLPLTTAPDVGFLLARCSAAGVRATNAALAELGLRARHYALLQVAAGSGGSSQRVLALELGLDPSAVVALVDDLEGAGLVSRTPDPADRRARLVVATDRGIAVLDQAAPLVADALAGVMAPLTGEENDILRGLLQRVADQLG
jgi:DNA-binding MarR family transcriptional regulator